MKVMTNLRAIVPLVLALCIALLGSFLTYKWIKSRMTPQQIIKVEADALPICVAAIDLTWGTKISKDNLKAAKFLKESLPSGYFSDLASLEGRVLISPVKQNEPILESRLAPTNVTTGGVAAIVKEGKRAIAVKGDKVIGLSGLIQPGNRVDVLVTLKIPGSKTRKEVTKIVLQDILVLAAGTQIEKNDKGEASPVDVYTLEVDPAEGETLSLSAAQGKLQFALRNVIDTKTVFTKGATISNTLSSFFGNSPKKSGKKQYSIARNTVYEIRGTTTRIKKF
jgi:pilus assembly protein CpaB